jgi:hypothetical protein
MEEHNKHWLCPYGCTGLSESLSEFRSHLQLQHVVAKSIFPSLSNSCARVSTVQGTVTCPLCMQTILNYGRWLKHLGHHLRQLALFALPSHLLSSNSDAESEADAPVVDEDGINETLISTWDLAALDLLDQSDREEDMADKFDTETQETRSSVGEIEGFTPVQSQSIYLPRTQQDSLPAVDTELDDGSPPVVPETDKELTPMDKYIATLEDAPGYFTIHTTQGTPPNLPEQQVYFERRRSLPSDGAESRRSRKSGSPEQQQHFESLPFRNGRSSSNASDHRDYILDLANPELTPSYGAESRRQQKHPATFQCTLCPKRFTRAYNLRSHLRTHTDERPFVCTVCGKAFHRPHDCERHERLHSGEKKYICRSNLQSTANWGCGRKYALADALGRHLRSEAGRVCIQPLLDEEAAERQKTRIEQERTQLAMDPVAPKSGLDLDCFLPATILQQYPALAGIDWNALPRGPPPDEEDHSSE